MSLQEQIAPYLNRFVLLLNRNASAKLEINCKEGRVNVNMSHDLENFAHTNPLQIQVPNHAIMNFRLHKRAAARAEQANVQADKQVQIARNNAELANTELKKAAEQTKKDAEKARTETLKHKKVAEKAMKDLEEANVMTEQVKARAEQLEKLKLIMMYNLIELGQKPSANIMKNFVEAYL